MHRSTDLLNVDEAKNEGIRNVLKQFKVKTSDCPPYIRIHKQSGSYTHLFDAIIKEIFYDKASNDEFCQELDNFSKNLNSNDTTKKEFNFKNTITSSKQSVFASKNLPKKENKKPKICQTIGDGNCFFHAVFGQLNQQNEYKTEKAANMRKEWHEFIAQYNSLADPKMPKELKKELKTSFTAILKELPVELEKTVVKMSRENIKKQLLGATNNIKILFAEIKSHFHNDQPFRDKLYQTIKEIYSKQNKIVPALDDLMINKNRLMNAINEDVFLCAKVLTSTLTKEHYHKKYDSASIEDEFCNSTAIYQNYFRATNRSDYFVFTEEISILASISNRIIILQGDKTEGNLRFEPIQGILEGYKKFCQSRNKKPTEYWPQSDNKPVFIDLEGQHFSRCENLLEDDQKENISIMNK